MDFLQSKPTNWRVWDGGGGGGGGVGGGGGRGGCYKYQLTPSWHSNSAGSRQIEDLEPFDGNSHSSEHDL